MYFSVDGVFLRKLVKRLLICLSIAGVFHIYGQLRDGTIRTHPGADAVAESILESLENVSDGSMAKAYLQDIIPKITGAAETILNAARIDYQTVINLCIKAFTFPVFRSSHIRNLENILFSG